MKEQAYQGKQLLSSGDLEEFGCLMHRGWELKKESFLSAWSRMGPG